MQILEEEDETLNRRRGVKNKRLRKVRGLTSGQGQYIQGQNAADVQLEGESHGNGVRKQKAETEQRRWGVCGKTRHNVRRCQIELKVSREDKND
jgi:hypothetical protein